MMMDLALSSSSTISASFADRASSSVLLFEGRSSSDVTGSMADILEQSDDEERESNEVY